MSRAVAYLRSMPMPTDPRQEFAMLVGMLRAFQDFEFEMGRGPTEMANAVLADLRHAGDARLLAPSTIEALRIGAVIPAAVEAARAADFEGARQWVVIGLGGDASEVSKVSDAGARELLVMATSPWGGSAAPFIASYAFLIFYLANFAGYLTEMSELNGEPLAEWLAVSPLSPETADAVPQALTWAARSGRKALSRRLQNWCFKQAGTTSDHVVSAGLRLAALAQGGEADSAERDRLLEECRSRSLPASLRLQVVAAAGGGSPDRTQELVPLLVQSIGDFWSEADSDDLNSHTRLRERRLGMIGAPVYALALGGHVNELLQVLQAWIGVTDPPEPKELRRVVFCVTGEATCYAWEERSEVIPVPSSIHELALATNAALGMALVGVGVEGAPTPLFAPAAQVTDRGAGQAFADAGDRLLGLFATPDVMKHIDEKSLLVPVPGQPVPYQALMRRHGTAPGLWVSLRPPLDDPFLDRALVVEGETELSELETKLVAEILGAGGVTVETIPVAKATTGRFMRSYLETDHDLIWVTGHGLLPAYAPHQATVTLRDGEELTPLDLAQAPDRDRTRRLLVLSACDGAATVLAGGLRSRGLAVAASGPSQCVVAHQWRVSEKLAANFAALLAIGLVEVRDFVGAYNWALAEIRRPWTEVAARLATFGCDAAVLHNLRPAVEFGDNILDYGAPALYC